MNKIFITSALSLLIASQSTLVHAKTSHVRALDSTKADNLIVEYTPPIWRATVRESTCNLTPSNPSPTLADYLDGDTDPITATSDYHEDYRWWITENHLCPTLFTP